MQQADLSNQISVAVAKKGREAAEQQGEAVNRLLADAADTAREMNKESAGMHRTHGHGHGPSHAGGVDVTA